MGTSNFKQWDESLTNLLTDADYNAAGFRQNGAVSGIFPSNVFNKFAYQQSTMTAALAQMLANYGYTVSDTSLSNLVAVLAKLPHGEQLITASGFFTVPGGVTEIHIDATQGGGGGGGQCFAGNTSTQGGGGGGGGAGQSVIGVLKTVVPGETLTITVGAGGPAGANAASIGVNGTAGGNGGITTITASVSGWTITLNSTNGGSGGLIQYSLVWGGPGGVNGGGSGWSVNNFNSASSGTSTAAAYGGKGADSPFGVGGSGATGIGTSPSTASSGYGSGGGGGASNIAPGNGSPGMVKIRW